MPYVMYSLSSMDAYTCMFPFAPAREFIFTLLSDSSLVQRDQRSDSGSNEDALVASVDGGVDARHVFGLDESADRSTLAEDDIRQ